MSILVCSMAFASCSSDVPTAPNEEETGNPQQPGDTEGSVSTVKFSLDFNSLSRANIPVDLDKYAVKVYVYQAVSTASCFGVSVPPLVLYHWNEWTDYGGYKLLDSFPYNGSPIDITLKEPKVRDVIVLGDVAYRYRYNIITVASTRGADALPDVSVGTSLSEQFTKSISNNKDLESIEIFKSNIEILPTGEIDRDGKPQTGGKLNIEGLTGDGEYNAETNNIKAVLKRKSGEVQVTVMKNAKDNIITNLLQAKTIDVTISYAASAIGFEPITSPVDTKTDLSYDVNLNGTATIKKTFPVDFNKNNAEVLLLESLPRYRYNERLDESYKGIELKLEFKDESGNSIKSISVAPEKKFYIFPNTRSTITLGKSGFEFGNNINLDDDSWDGIH